MVSVDVKHHVYFLPSISYLESFDLTGCRRTYVVTHPLPEDLGLVVDGAGRQRIGPVLLLSTRPPDGAVEAVVQWCGFHRRHRLLRGACAGWRRAGTHPGCVTHRQLAHLYAVSHVVMS